MTANLKPLHSMQHDIDPALNIKEKVGPLDGVNLSGAQVLVGTYIRPEKTKSGIFLTDNMRQEDEYQGKVGLVLKRGPLAFKDDATHVFADFNPKEDEWVFYRAADGYSMSVNGHHCRLLEDVHVRGTVKDPTNVM